MTDDEILAQWRHHVAETDRLCEIYIRDPGAAALAGVTPVDGDPEQQPGFIRTKPPINERARWLRGIAKATIPANFEWQVMEMIGGGAGLMLLKYDPSPDREADPFDFLRRPS